MTITCANPVERQRALAAFGEFALRCDDAQTILDSTCHLVRDALGVELAAVLERSAAGDHLLVRAGVGWRPGTVGQAMLPLADGSAESIALKQGRLIAVSDITAAMRAGETPFVIPDLLREHRAAAFVDAPIFLPGGTCFGLIQIAACAAREFDEQDTAFLRVCCTLLGAMIDRWTKDTELGRREEQFRLVVENAHGFGIILSDANDIITKWFPGAEEVFGWREEEVIGKPIATIFTADDRASGIPERETARAGTLGKAPNIRWHVTRSGRRVFVDGQTIALRNPDGGIRGYLKIGQDLTERKLNEERQTVLLAELQHRVRNVLAMVASVIKRGDVAVGTQEFRDRLGGRIAAMARTQVLLTRSADDGVDLESIVRDEFVAQAAEEGRVSAGGPPISLSSKAAEVLTLAVHELATNAVKYGALLQPQGHIDVQWRLEPRDEQEWLVFEWRESGVDNPPLPNPRQGFGTELISRRVPYELRGEGEVMVEADGVRCRIAFPLAPGDSVLQTNSPALPPSPQQEALGL